MFSIKLYKSEFSIFMDEFMRKNSYEVLHRNSLLKTWWENPLSTEEQEDFSASNLASKAYPYQVD